MGYALIRLSKTFQINEGSSEEPFKQLFSSVQNNLKSWASSHGFRKWEQVQVRNSDEILSECVQIGAHILNSFLRRKLPESSTFGNGHGLMFDKCSVRIKQFDREKNILEFDYVIISQVLTLLGHFGNVLLVAPGDHQHSLQSKSVIAETFTLSLENGYDIAEYQSINL